ncbi:MULTISPECIES: N-acetylmuramic acid 6-phosphate etherase [unclassified Pseudodesulfovibrio]|uniref:N-acetylmuramic acid 6-phosphate etherase n=1 Tax=unclassified Pseudodesulfovibrio TaxID=2661612 RepID=UPI000FEC0A43|nr:MULTISPECIES: N-acetylmuramic acid 6-phosphate etherase [unclassified Pseudodesulfovibrio]MCJ2163228.1 N-acetylmuramic acid 6-phosphate etherase [Pseudodesulfovibrio sp. S3-i]RWU07211.1 N-acetylmuramic acid 6-phosphate etherase [Pseudodesulfovibrio sp. S3]
MSAKIDSTPSVTEHVSHGSAGIDTWPSEAVLSVLWQDQLDGVSAVEKAISHIEKAALATVERLRIPDSRLIYVGAGTSGVLAALDGLELPCTFGWPKERLAVFRADDPNNILTIETAGDDGLDAARNDMEKSAVCELDVVVTVSASGSTPYTCLFAELARKHGALVVAIANNTDAKLLRIADHPILLETGPEVIAGSTRLKAGTSQKTALNLFSTLVMIRLGHVYDGMMVDLEPGNGKLRDRAARMVATIAGVEDETARKALAESNGHVKTAVLTATGLTPTQARSVLSESGQNLRTALIRIAEA